MSRASSKVAFSSSVSTVYAWNAWDHDPPFSEENGCILWLGLPLYGGPSNNDNNKYQQGSMNITEDIINKQ